MAAREVGRLDLSDALELVLLMQREDDPRFERAAVRWLGRFLAKRPSVGFEGASELLDALAGIDGAMPEVSRSTLAILLRNAGLPRAADAVAGGWRDSRRST